jgi:hypothetical protein
MEKVKKNNWKKIRKAKLGKIPYESSNNLSAPEVAPLRNRKERTQRLRPLGLKVREEFYWQIKALALKEKRLMIEVIETAIEEYRKRQEGK